MSNEETKLVTASVTVGSLQVQITVKRASVEEHWPSWNVCVRDDAGSEVCLDARAATSEAPTSVVDDIVLNSLGFNSRGDANNPMSSSSRSDFQFPCHEYAYPNSSVVSEILSSPHPFKMRRTNENHHVQHPPDFLDAFPSPNCFSRSLLPALAAPDPANKDVRVTDATTETHTVSAVVSPAGSTDATELTALAASEKASTSLDKKKTDSKSRSPMAAPEVSNTTRNLESNSKESLPSDTPAETGTHEAASGSVERGPKPVLVLPHSLAAASSAGVTLSPAGASREAIVLTSEEQAVLKGVHWPQVTKPGSELPTLYCHLCYLREKAFKKIEATSPHGNRVYFRHRACSASYGNGEAFPKSLVDLYVTHFLTKRQVPSKRKA